MLGKVETRTVLLVAKMKVPAVVRHFDRAERNLYIYNLRRRSSCTVQFSVIKVSFTYIYYMACVLSIHVMHALIG